MDDIEMGAKSHEDYIYVMVIYDSLTYSNVAFRKGKGSKEYRTKDVICRYCKRVFDTMDVRTRIEVFRCSPKTEFVCHKQKHCKLCNIVSNANGVTFKRYIHLWGKPAQQNETDMPGQRVRHIQDYSAAGAEIAANATMVVYEIGYYSPRYLWFREDQRGHPRSRRT